MKYTNKLSPERYLNNKEYFDNGLIEALKHQTEENKKLKDKLEIYEAKRLKDAHTIRTLTFKVRDLNIQVLNLKHKDNQNNDDIGKLENEIRSLYDILNDEISSRDNTINELLDIIKKQEVEIGDLKRKEKKNRLADTTNTNNPTSTYRFDDAVKDEKRKKKPCNSREKSGKPRGGQAGHKSTRRSLGNDFDHVYEVKVQKAPSGAECVYDEYGNIKYYRVQVKDARLMTTTDEYRFYEDPNGICLNEATMMKFKISPMVYSVHLKSQILYLQSKGVVALDRLCMIINEMSQGELNITPGSVVNWEKEFNEVSKEFRKYVLEQILNTWIAHVDETGFKVNGKQSWVHVICTELYAYFVMTGKRKDKEFGPLKLLEEFQHILIHDHYRPYYDLLKCIHAECNAHILRYMQAGVDFDEIAGCAEMMELLKKALHRKNELIEQGVKEMDPAEYEEYKAEFLDICEHTISEYENQHKGIPAKYIPEGIKTLKRMKEYCEEHLLFLKDFDVPFSNNDAERQCRVIKAHKKISGQCYSLDTAEYLTSLLTVIQTANLQGINTLSLMDQIMAGRWTRPEKDTATTLS